MQTKTKEMCGYEEDIQKATGAPVEILPILEHIMRDEIFHSTLDWQTARQFNTAARKAYRLYREDQTYYDLQHAWLRSRWPLALAETALAEAEKSGDAHAIRLAKAGRQAALTAHGEAYTRMANLH